VSAFPVLYLTYLLITQVRSDWPTLFDPGWDADTLLALAASGYLVLLIASYWSKPAFVAQRRDAFAIITTVIAIDAFGVISRQPITQPDAWLPAVGLMITGTIVAACSLRSLGTSFSLLPQARNVVATGPYAYLRHPMYAGGILITLGELWLRWSPLAILVCAVAVLAQLVRIRIEERLLENQFPSYRSYRARTSALIPGIY
jgi:protein-S-isoprenylcysteine O-methyltransferase Ste14